MAYSKNLDIRSRRRCVSAQERREAQIASDHSFVSPRSWASWPSSTSNYDGVSANERRETHVASGKAGRAKRDGGKRTRSVPPLFRCSCVGPSVSRTEGIMSGLFPGIESTMLGEMLQCAIYYPSYEVTKDLLIRRSRTGKSSVPEPALQMLAGGIAGCATWLPPVYCLDVIKTRI
ncbi:unnamed protein product [Ectocarpus sp. CCAP 1310/34]|nr:unnamed protein product [Ectocarpus sp. CCAP 1310/34]